MEQRVAPGGADFVRTVPSAIEIEKVEHWFRDSRTGKPVHAVAEADLVVEPGEFVSIVGPSGCGKTTLLNMAAGLFTPTKGAVRINGQPVTGVQPALIGYMQARDTLLPWRNVLGNISFGLDSLGKEERDATARRFLDLVALNGFEDAYPDQLSHGMRQRVALARTLAPNPAFLLMDEPFGALDAQTKMVMEEEFLRIWEADQKTVLFVTHDLTEALMLSDRVLVMSARPGRIKAEYTLDFQRPRDPEALPGDPRFALLMRKVWEDLKSENIRSRAGES